MSARLGLAIMATVYALAVWLTGGDVPDTPVVYSSSSDVTSLPQPVESFIMAPATVAATAQRGAQVQVAATSPAPTPTVPTWTPGDCDSFRPVLAHLGATAQAVTFFVDQGILRRESGCGRDLLNEATLDTGPCQINPAHNRPGWFDGVEYGEGGWLYARHQLTAGINPAAPAWLEACITLWNACGSGPWTPPYSCRRP